MKMLNFATSHSIFPTSSVNFENIFIFSESLLAQDHFGINGTRIHPLLKKINIAPQEMIVIIQFLWHSDLRDSLNNNIKFIFL